MQHNQYNNKNKKNNPELMREATEEIKKMNKTKVYTSVLMVGVALIVGALVFKNKDTEKEKVLADIAQSEQNPEENKESEQKSEEAGQETSGGMVVGNSIEGVLQTSDNPARGNLKLVSKVGDVYLKTAKDFSKLLGLQVSAFIEGTLDKFRLVDIRQ